AGRRVGDSGRLPDRRGLRVDPLQGSHRLPDFGRKPRPGGETVRENQGSHRPLAPFAGRIVGGDAGIVVVCFAEPIAMKTTARKMGTAYSVPRSDLCDAWTERAVPIFRPLNSLAESVFESADARRFSS